LRDDLKNGYSRTEYVYVWQEEKSIRDFWLEATLLHETTRYSSLLSFYHR